MKNYSFKKYLKLIPLIILFSLYLFKRVDYINQAHLNSYKNNDFLEYEKALDSLLKGENPYTETIKTYNYKEGDRANPDHGFAYFPLFLYVLIPLYYLAPVLNTSLFVLSRIPVLIGDVVCGLILVRILYKKDYLASIFAACIYLFNPHNLTKDTYTFFDPLAILFIFLSIVYLNKNNLISGIFFAVSIGFKSFAYILFPLLLLLSKEKKKFIIGGSLTGLAISAPFLRSLEFFSDYIRGSLLVHSERPIQGRPLPFFISYFYKIEFLQLIPIKIYTYLASFSGFIVSLLIWLKFKFSDKYILSSLSFILFYLFTPVLNKTYLIFFIPIFILGAYNFAELFKKKYIYYIILLTFYLFYTWYLSIWEHGFHQHMHL